MSSTVGLKTLAYQTPEVEEILSDTIRCAPVLSALYDGLVDDFMVVGQSVRARDKKTGYYRFVINDEDDIAPLVEEISGDIRYAVAVDAAYEETWREVLPEGAVFTRYRLSVVTKDMFTPSEEYELPEGAELVKLDEAWRQSIIEHWADEEFTAESFRQQLEENPSIGLLVDGKQAGYVSTHINGELGPLFISPEFRGRKLASILFQGYLREYFKIKPIVFVLLAPDNHAIRKSCYNVGYRETDEDVLHISIS